MIIMSRHPIDPYHSAAMLSLGGIKTFVFAWQAWARGEFSARLAVQKQSSFLNRPALKDCFVV